jgi:PIN domain nuclease of toxin-antitoxin system
VAAGGETVILDTCALLWLAEGSHQISRATRAKIEKAPIVYVSAISGFEISLKCRSGKLDLPAPPAEWLRTTLDHHDLAVVPLDMDVCTVAADLPPIHKDPCDRFIVATAKINGWPVVTADENFKAYGVETLI